MEKFWKKKAIVSYILSILVFLIHISTFSNYTFENVEKHNTIIFLKTIIQNVFTPFAVPLFFIISGVLFFRDYSDEKYLKKMRNRFYSLFIPYILWNIISLTFSVFTSYSFLNKYFLGREIFEINVVNIFKAIFLYSQNKQFWFIFDLIIFSISAPIINFLLSSKKRAIFSFFIIGILAQFNIGLPEAVFFKKSAICFYLLGGYIGKFYFKKFYEAPKNYANYSILFMCGIIYSIFINFFGLENYIFIEIIVLSLASISLWYLFDLFINKIGWHSIFTHSFAIYAMHVNVSAIITKILYIILPKTVLFSLINFVVTVILTLIGIEFICFFIKKISIKLYGLLISAR